MIAKTILTVINKIYPPNLQKDQTGVYIPFQGKPHLL